jgi:hypothetical protein
MYIQYNIQNMRKLAPDAARARARLSESQRVRTLLPKKCASRMGAMMHIQKCNIALSAEGVTMQNFKV